MPGTSGQPARRADIQGLRAVAVLVVVLYHAHVGFSGGFVGVDVFFVISGFVITQLLWREAETTGRTSFRDFYSRRVKRILPALAVMLAVVLPASTLLAAYEAQASTARTGIAAALFNANNYLAYFGLDGGYFAVGATSNPLLHTWSLSVEEQFYIGFPALLAFLFWLGRRQRTRRPFFIGVGGLAVASFVLSVAARRGWLPVGSGTAAAFYLAPFRAWEFAVGALVAGVVACRPTVLSRWRPVLSTVGAIAVIASALVFDDATVFPDFAVLVPVLGTAMLLVGGLTSRQNPITYVLTRRPMGFLGDVSYSWYLWHWPFIVFGRAMWQEVGAAAPLAAVLSLVPAVLSYRLVEDPIRRRPLVSMRRVALLAAACMVLPVIGSFVLMAGTSRLVSSDAVVPFVRHVDSAEGCDSRIPLDERPQDSCLWTVDDPQGEILLVGDSNAGQFTEAVLASAEELRMNVRVATFSSCPMIDLRLFLDGDENHNCHKFVHGALDWMRANPSTLVIVASASDGYIEGERFALASGASDAPASDPAAKAAIWESALVDTLRAIRETGAMALVVHPIPKIWFEWRPRLAAPARLLLGPEGFAASVSRDEAVVRRSRALDAERGAAASSQAATADFFERLCPAARCWTYRDGRWLYRDQGHITVAGAVLLTPEFTREISALLAS